MDDSAPTGPLLPPPFAALPDPGLLEERYEIEREVARGGMGVVYRARHRALDRDVAIKVVLPGGSPERFLREARLLARTRSPYIVDVHDCEVLPDGSPVLVMEWIDGRDLARLMQAHGGLLPEAVALPLMREVCQAMIAAGALGIVHRDLKPSNILVDGEGHARVVDFGLARGPADPAASMTGEILGTAFYMAPEQWEDPPGVDTRADIYGFGATFYHALTGVVPFAGHSAVSVLLAHKTEPLIVPRSRNPQISAHTSEVLERCLAKRRADRFRDFDELLAVLGTGSSPWDAPEDPALAPHLARYASRRDTYLLRVLGEAEEDDYEFPGRRLLRIRRGSIVDQAVEAVVSSDDGSLTMRAGVSRAIRDAGGPQVWEEARRYPPVRAGRVVVTSGGRLRARYVFHATTLEFSRDRPHVPSRDLISEILAACFYQADSLYVEKIALPLLGTGSAGYAEDVCLDTMFRVIARTFQKRGTGVREATIVLFP